MVSTRPPTSKSSSPLVTVPKVPITIGIIVTFMFHTFFKSLARSAYLSFFSHSFIFILWSAGTAKSTILQVLFFLLIIIRSGLLAEIRWSVCKLKSHRSFVLFSMMLLQQCPACLRDELIRDVLLWTPWHGRAKAGRPARTYIQQLCEDTGCCPEDLPRAMNNREEWRERVRDIRATSATWWWWWWWFSMIVRLVTYNFETKFVFVLTWNNVCKLFVLYRYT